MREQLESLRQQLREAIDKAGDLNTLEAVRLQAIGKQGTITLLMKSLGTLPPDERRETGQAFNVLREEIVNLLFERKELLEEQAMDVRLRQETIDVSLPARPSAVGSIHPLSQTRFEILSIFQQMGFDIAHGPDIEDDVHNFTALNIPAHHPARQDHDTFYLPTPGDGYSLLLRTHTSPVQIRAMKVMKPPLRLIAPGRVYRSDLDQTHTPTFHQVEGLVIDKHSHMGHLKGCLEEFCQRFFEVDSLPMRFRPGYFPFTEPSAEIDIQWQRPSASGGQRWLEILGAGMVHPAVLRNCGLDPEEYQGFAFGMGCERLTMLKYNIPDLRSFYESDLRWLKHYGFSVVQALGGAPVL